MNDLARKQIRKDYEEILKSESGRRVLGGIFYAARLNSPGPLNDYMQGRRDLGLAIANTVREVSPYLLANCEMSYLSFIKEFSDDRRTDDSGNDGISRGYDE